MPFAFSTLVHLPRKGLRCGNQRDPRTIYPGSTVLRDGHTAWKKNDIRSTVQGTKSVGSSHATSCNDTEVRRGRPGGYQDMYSTRTNALNSIHTRTHDHTRTTKAFVRLIGSSSTQAYGHNKCNNSRSSGKGIEQCGVFCQDE